MEPLRPNQRRNPSQRSRLSCLELLFKFAGRPFFVIMSVALAAQLREGTKKSHTMAENTGFVSCFLKESLIRPAIGKLG